MCLMVHAVLLLWPSDGGGCAGRGLNQAFAARFTSFEGLDALSGPPVLDVGVVEAADMEDGDVMVSSGLARKLLHGCHKRSYAHPPPDVTIMLWPARGNVLSVPGLCFSACRTHAAI